MWWNVQVKIPCLQSRFDHSAAAFSLSPRLTEVTIFGGCPEVPRNYRTPAGPPQIANTTVLRFGEYTCILLKPRLLLVLYVLFTTE